MVSSIQVYIIGVDEKKCKQDYKYFHRILPSVNKITIKDIRFFF